MDSLVKESNVISKNKQIEKRHDDYQASLHSQVDTQCQQSQLSSPLK